jgi:hypothetical protein
MAAAQRLAEMADFGIMPAADELEQGAVRTRVRQFQRIEVVSGGNSLSPRIDNQ